TRPSRKLQFAHERPPTTAERRPLRTFRFAPPDCDREILSWRNLMKKSRTTFVFMVLALLLASISATSAQIESDADFDWGMFADQGIELHMLAIQGPWIDAVEPRIAEFEEATGIDVTLEV